MSVCVTSVRLRIAWRVGIAILPVLLSLPAQALQPPDQGGNLAEPATPVKPDAQDRRSQQQPARKPARPAGSGDTYTPSERIQADSSVSFPVDI